MDKILVIGAGGQLGTELTYALTQQYGAAAVIASDFQESVRTKFDYCEFRTLNILDTAATNTLIQSEKITQVYHLAAVLSASGEKNPMEAWQLNMGSLLAVLELAKKYQLEKIFWPSSIAVFGPNSEKENTSQRSYKDPSTVYGISKLSGEHWCDYYFNKYGVDVRSLRYPGLIGYKSIPGGGTTDYAVDIFHKAFKKELFECFLAQDTHLPMMYMEDAVKATLQLMNAPKENISVRTSYNIAGMSFTPKQIFECLLTYFPDFKIQYKPDFRQAIADSWPKSINDETARKDWNWAPSYDLNKMTEAIIKNLPAQFGYPLFYKNGATIPFY
jgi:nucleoside-diphosphate-sugar epimerase